MSDRPEPSSARRHPFLSLIAARVREFLREPTAIFWVYVFPLVLVVALGVAFRNKPVGGFRVAVPDGDRRCASPAGAGTRAAVFASGWAPSRRAGRGCGPGGPDLVIIPAPTIAGGYDYYFDPTQANSVLARARGRRFPAARPPHAGTPSRCRTIP